MNVAPPDIRSSGYLQAAVARANHAAFRAGADIGWDAVGSRCLIWGLAGRGLIRSGGRTFDVTPGTVLFLPWGHDIRYLGASGGPFSTGCVHLLPWADPAAAVVREVAHGRHDPMWSRTDRADVEWPGFARARSISGGTAVRLMRLGECVVDSTLEAGTPDAVLRAFGLLIAQTLLGPATRPDLDIPMPPTLRAMQQHALLSLSTALDAEALAAVAGCSRSTAERQFRRYTGRSVQEWLRDARLDRAAKLLRVTTLRVGEVGHAVGFPDPLHFSRLFRRRFGSPPSRFRQEAAAD